MNLDTSPVEDIQLAVFRYQFYDNGSGLVNRGKIDSAAGFFGVTCGDYGDSVQFWRPENLRSVPDHILLRLVPAAIPVRNFSECVWDSSWIYDSPGGTLGILVWEGPIRVKGLLNAEAEGGYYRGARNAEGDIFFLSYRGDSWQVDSLKARFLL